jgi:photosystem II stability/assembly factor-like uncharacterized protein
MTTVAVGTEKGAFLFRSDDRGHWEIEGPIQPGWRVTTFGRTPSGAYLMATGSNWFGAALHRSDDLKTFEQVVDGPAWAEGGERKLNNVWVLTNAGDRMFAGVDEAGLFFSDDDGASWHGVEAFNEHETRPRWEPGFGGLAAHRILVDGANPSRMWVGVSAVGVFHTQDGGDSWHLRDTGISWTTAPEESEEESPDTGYCVHCLVADPSDPDTIWRQDHSGVYRTRDGAEHWERIEEGLPARFGFPINRDPNTGALFVIPLTSDQHRMPVDGEFRIYRSTNGGDSWDVSGTGHPEAGFYGGVLRDAMATDGLDPCGIYVGTTAGTLHFSADGGDSWAQLDHVLPRILSVAVLDA